MVYDKSECFKLGTPFEYVGIDFERVYIPSQHDLLGQCDRI